VWAMVVVVTDVGSQNAFEMRFVHDQDVAHLPKDAAIPILSGMCQPRVTLGHSDLRFSRRQKTLHDI
jgi:hypothetical protein